MIDFELGNRMSVIGDKTEEEEEKSAAVEKFWPQKLRQMSTSFIIAGLLTFPIDGRSKSFELRSHWLGLGIAHVQSNVLATCLLHGPIELPVMGRFEK